MSRDWRQVPTARDSRHPIALEREHNSAYNTQAKVMDAIKSKRVSVAPLITDIFQLATLVNEPAFTSLNGPDVRVKVVEVMGRQSRSKDPEGPGPQSTRPGIRYEL